MPNRTPGRRQRAHNQNVIAYICLVHFLIHVKTKINCKTESYFLIMFSMVGCVWIRERAACGPRVENHWYRDKLSAQIQSHVEKLIQRRFRVQTDPKHTENARVNLLISTWLSCISLAEDKTKDRKSHKRPSEASQRRNTVSADVHESSPAKHSQLNITMNILFMIILFVQLHLSLWKWLNKNIITKQKVGRKETL